MSFRAFISIDLARIQEIEDYIVALKSADPHPQGGGPQADTINP
jgi:hypothetical protein